MTSREHTTPLAEAAGLLLSLRLLFWINLAIKKNSLAHFSKRMMQLRKAASYYNLLFSGSFNSRLRVLFSVPSWYYALSVLKIFRIGSRCLPYSRANLNARYSFTSNKPHKILLRGYHPLKQIFPDYFTKPQLVLTGTTSP